VHVTTAEELVLQYLESVTNEHQVSDIAKLQRTLSGKVHFIDFQSKGMYPYTVAFLRSKK